MDSLSRAGRRLLLALLLGSIGLGVLACGDDQTAEGVNVVNPRLVKTSVGQRAFTGTLVNGRSRSLSIAQVEVALYDGKGSTVETVRLEVEDVPAQDSVSFSHKIDSDKAFRQAQVQSVLTP